MKTETPFERGFYETSRGFTQRSYFGAPEDRDSYERGRIAGQSELETIYCAANEYGCDNTISAEREGELCAPCETERQKTAAYYERMYRASKNDLPIEDVLDAYSDPTDRSKRERMLNR